MKVAGKLTALLGLPLLVLFSIFASGVYCGAVRADRVVELEQRWFGVEPPAGRLLDGEDAGAGDDGAAAETPEQPKPEPTPAVEQPKPESPKPEQPKPIEQPKPEPATEQSSLAPAKADPVGAELRSRFEEPRVVRLKIMVDPALVVAREDWLSTIAELFEATRVSYERLFGIDLQLHGVVVWDDAVGADASALLGDLAGRDRDGADVLLGLIAREQPTDFSAARWTADVTGDHALVFADLKQPDRHYRNLLRALALLFGAEPALDAEARQLGSFMSDGAVNDGAPVLDPENRGKVIINKRRPIAAPAPAPESPPVEGEPEAPAAESEGI